LERLKDSAWIGRADAANEIHFNTLLRTDKGSIATIAPRLGCGNGFLTERDWVMRATR
jgi:hypothetical protein